MCTQSLFVLSHYSSSQPPGRARLRGRTSTRAAHLRQGQGQHEGGEGTADWDTAASNRSTCLELIDRELFFVLLNKQQDSSTNLNWQIWARTNQIYWFELDEGFRPYHPPFRSMELCMDSWETGKIQLHLHMLMEAGTNKQFHIYQAGQVKVQSSTTSSRRQHHQQQAAAPPAAGGSTTSSRRQHHQRQTPAGRIRFLALARISRWSLEVLTMISRCFRSKSRPWNL